MFEANRNNFSDKTIVNITSFPCICGRLNTINKLESVGANVNNEILIECKPDDFVSFAKIGEWGYIKINEIEIKVPVALNVKIIHLPDERGMPKKKNKDQFGNPVVNGRGVNRPGNMPEFHLRPGSMAQSMPIQQNRQSLPEKGGMGAMMVESGRMSALGDPGRFTDLGRAGGY
jgi:hypothetical protein